MPLVSTRRLPGHSYRSQEEIENHIGYHLAHEFEPGNYDSLTHNCNHFSASAQPVPLGIWMNLGDKGGTG